MVETQVHRLGDSLGGPGARRAIWLVYLAVPLLGLVLLRLRPALDLRLEHHPAHFWIVVTGALVNVLLSVWVSEAARQRGDARLLLVSFTFLCCAGFLLLHALATPKVLLQGANTGFVIATPVGLFLGAFFAAASAADLGTERAALVLRWQVQLRVLIAVALVAWGVASLLELPPFDVVYAEDATHQLVHGLALVSVVLYALAAFRYARLLRDRPSRVAIAVAVAFALLAEAMIAIAFAHSWHATWWEWHVLMAVAFGLVAWSARAEYRREGAPARAFDAIALEETVNRIHEQYDAAVRALVTEMRRDPETGPERVSQVATRIARRYHLTEGQVRVLERAAAEIAELLREQAAAVGQRERIEQELRLAQLVQQQFLPAELPQLPGWRLDAWYRPAREVGGDFYDFIELPGGRLGIVAGDVSGKGVPAALVMASTHSVLRAEAPRLVAPAEVLERANELLVTETQASVFVTCLYMVLDPATGKARWANAGHNLPYLRTADGVAELRATGMPLGLLPGMDYEEKSAELPPGANLLLHSDGLSEAHGPDREMFGLPRLAGLAGRAPGQALIDLLLAELGRFTGPGWEQEDDITLVTLQRLAAPGTTA
jgi:serine phosphatase RsbU (regulator of sigma subunit)